MADSQLQKTRSAISRASAPEGSGKSVDLVLYTCDGRHGTMDPAFDAHVLPLKTWATAWWESWRSSAKLAGAILAAQEKLSTSIHSLWRRVAGPTAAVVATAHRLGWTIPNPSSLRTDRGRVLDLLADPPAVVAAEARDAVRQWRFRKLLPAFHILFPPRLTSATLDEVLPSQRSLLKVTRLPGTPLTSPMWSKS